MALPPALVDNRGQPIPSATIARIRENAQRGSSRMRGSLSGGGAGNFFPYDAANFVSQDQGDWYPSIRSPDTEINLYRDRMAAKARDLRRNDGWASGAINGILDSTIGAAYRFVSKPDYRALRLYAKGFDAVWANEYRQVL
ncbi:phage portal protein, partial [Pseudomonas canadensis]|uniref:phage portal protein n=1 Tax=Pseudomonas canadensis TaxID=915099 RepID=UPI0030DCBCD8